MTDSSQRTLLVALDASPRKDQVLDRAIELSRALGASLVLLRAVGLPPELPREAYSVAPDALPGLLVDEARKDLELLAGRVPPECRPTVRVELGVAADVVCRLADELGVDLVVLGSHGYSRLERMLGTTASRVVNHCHRNVFVVRAKA